MIFPRSISNAAYLRNGKCNLGTRRCFCCKSQLGLAVAGLAPVTSASYRVLLLGGGLFAFAKSGNQGSVFGGLTGAPLMASVGFQTCKGSRGCT
ncbi:protein FATTY ACID EXPORT 4, chloroplastic-like [Pistacia vera]|uniref:protein FATTY ACID EXPORT 4, chloroplastic-like n=1 Tax=Pistacia vera TaxID=55513 RepID=UPI0012630757|nr:protein FATTY ACID EXPORT 4, chloroplastic-like [Pistacia vera]